MDLQLTGRTALVTGASHRLGRAIASALAMEGVQVAIAARRLELLRQLTQKITDSGGVAPLTIQADLSEAGAAARLAGAAEQSMGKIDILVNAAGGSRTLVFEAAAESWQEAMLINYEQIRQPGHAAQRLGTDCKTLQAARNHAG